MWRLLRGGVGDRRRLAHTLLATTLAVSLLSGTLIFADTIQRSFRDAAAPSSGSPELLVRTRADFTANANSLAEREPLPASTVESVASVPGVQAAWGLVFGYAQLVDERGEAVPSRGLPPMGTSWSPEAELVRGRAPAGAGEVVVDEDTARNHDLVLGDRVKVIFTGSVEEFTLVGLRDSGQWVASSLASFDVATAQSLLGRDGRFDAVAVRAAAPELTSVRSRLGVVLPAGFEVATTDQVAQEAKASWTRALRFLEVALMVFAAVALLVGSFVIANTFAVVVGQRSRELALLRSVGASRAQLMTAVLVEAVSVGAFASALGVVAGLGTARGLFALMGGAGFELPGTPVVFLPRTALAGLLCGVVVTVAAALLPAWRATRVSMIAAVSGGGEDSDSGRLRRLAVGGSATVAGAAALLVGLFTPVQPRLAPIAAGGVALLVGVAVLIPVLAGPAARIVGLPLVRVFGEPALLGRENAVRNPRRTGATAAALTVGIGLVGVMGILAASMTASAGHSVSETLRADFVVRADAFSDGVPPVAADRLRATAGVDVVSEVRSGQWGLNGRAQSLLAVDPATLGSVQEMDAGSIETARRLRPGTVAVSRGAASRHGWQVGQWIPMTFARTGTQAIEVVGTFTSPVPTDYVISLETFDENYAQQQDKEVRVRLAPGTPTSAGRARIEAVLADLPTVEVMDRVEVLAAQEEQVAKVLMPVTALLALSVLIALLGIANTLALSVHERSREIGLLRSIGMAKRQLRAMIRSEAVIIAALGAFLGIAIAGVLGWALVRAMGGLGVTELVLPVRQLLAWVALATAAGLVAAILPARRATRVAVLEAVAKP